jgi:hypothetical protein
MRGAVDLGRALHVYYPPEGAWETIETERNRIAFEEGRIRFDPEGVRCILEHTAQCPSANEPPSTCPPMWVATSTRAEGDPCGSRYECGAGMACTDPRQRCGAGLGTCVQRAREGEGCAMPGETGRGCDQDARLACVDHVCARLDVIAFGEEGALCNTVTRDPDGRVVARYCAPGLGCDAGVPAHCIPASTPCGETSCPGFTECVADACVPIATPQAGDVCGGAQGLCAWSSFALMCDGETHRCVETHRRLGEPCAHEWAPCIEGVCRFEPSVDGASGTDRCGAPRTIGEPCLRDLECASHACCDGVCGS